MDAIDDLRTQRLIALIDTLYDSLHLIQADVEAGIKSLGSLTKIHNDADAHCAVIHLRRIGTTAADAIDREA